GAQLNQHVVRVGSQRGLGLGGGLEAGDGALAAGQPDLGGAVDAGGGGTAGDLTPTGGGHEQGGAADREHGDQQQHHDQHGGRGLGSDHDLAGQLPVRGDRQRQAVREHR